MGPRRLLPLLIVLATAAPAAAQLPIPPLAAEERGAYRARDARTGEEVGRAEWILQQQTEAGRPVLRVRQDGSQTKAGDGRTAWSERLTLDLRGAHPVLTAAREIRDQAGRPVQLERRRLDYDVGSGEVVTTEPRTGETQSRSLRLTAQAVTPELLPAVLRLLPGERAQRMRLDLVTAEGRTIGLQARVVGRERVRVPAGIFECFKVALELTGLTGALAALKLPPLFMWHTVAAPHFWVKYEGPDGGPGSRQVVRELLRFETRAAAAGPPPDPALSPPPAPPGPSAGAGARPRGRRGPDAPALASLLVLAAVLFEIGVEATRLLADARPAPAHPRPRRDPRA